MQNRKRAKRVNSGGIVIGYLAELEHNIEIIHTESNFVLWCKISNVIGKNEDIIRGGGVVYIHPEYTYYSSDDAFSEVENEYFRISVNFNKVLLLGDFNARTAKDKDYVILEGNGNFGLDIEELTLGRHL